MLNEKYHLVITSVFLFVVSCGLLLAENRLNDSKVTCDANIISLPIKQHQLTLIAADGHKQYATHDYALPITSKGTKVTFVYMSNDSFFSSRAWSYDYKDGTITGPVDLGGTGQDPHNYPNIIMDKNGFYYVFYGCHSSPLYCRKSAFPENASAWGQPFTIDVNATYPRPFVRDNGNLAVFCRDHNRKTKKVSYGYIESADSGKTWSKHRALIHNTESELAYVGGVWLDHNDIHICWSWYISPRKTKSGFPYDELSYAKFSFISDKAFDADGKIHSVPVEKLGIKPIINMPQQYAQDITLDENSNPVILFTDYDGTNDDGVKIAWWNKSQWDIERFDPNVHTFQQRFAHIPKGIITLCTFTNEGLKILQKKSFEEKWKSRILTTHTGQHPAIMADINSDRYHVFWTGSDGMVLYLWSNKLTID